MVDEIRDLVTLDYERIVVCEELWLLAFTLKLEAMKNDKI